MVEIRHDAAAEGVAKQLFCSRRTDADFASDLPDAQAIAHAGEQESANLLGHVGLRAALGRRAAQSLLDLTEERQERAGQRRGFAGFFGCQMIRSEPEALMQFSVARSDESMQSADEPAQIATAF